MKQQHLSKFIIGNLGTIRNVRQPNKEKNKLRIWQATKENPKA